MIVDQLWRFPVKSMLGERLDRAEVTDRGVLGDRGWALADAEDGKVVSAKNPRKWGRVLELRAAYVTPPELGQPAPPVAIELPDGRVVRSDEEGTDAALSAFLERDVRLVASAPPEGVAMEETWPDIEGLAPESFIESTQIDTGVTGERVSDIRVGMAAPPGTFFDLSTLHLLTTSTLAALSAAYPEGTFDVRRYRPNVLVATDDAGFVENAWVGARIGLGDGGAGMQVALPTMRCIMTTLAQPDLAADTALLRTIARTNRLEIGGGEWACAGVYGNVAGTGTVRVGDPVTVAHHEGAGNG